VIVATPHQLLGKIRKKERKHGEKFEE